jgi:ribosomal protein S18 acetylase RimI-like enzyme
VLLRTNSLARARALATLEGAMAAESLTFRRAIASDVSAIVSLVESAYRGDTSRTGWTTEADMLEGQRTDGEEVRALIAQKHGFLLLAFSGEALVASLALSDIGDRRAYLGMFAVSPQKQGGGVGRAMLAEAERVARHEFGASFMRMTVIAQRTELIAWYERCGFTRTGAREPFPYGDPRFGLPVRDDLYFEVLEKPL